MRTKNSIKNVFYNFLLNFITILIGLVTQSIFIRVLGNEYNGLKSLFTSIVSMLSISELGFGIAIIYNLYRPVAENDKEKIKTLIKYYKKIYTNIACVIFILGLCLMPFLDLFFGKITIDVNLKLLFFLYLLDAACSYLMTYKRSILLANQKEYLISKINIIYLLLVNVFQIVVLLSSESFILYLIVRILFRILENITINWFANRKYGYLKEKDVEPIDKDVKKDIFTRVKGLLFHKIGDYIVNGTDSLIISVCLGINTLGLYNNYYFITNYVNVLFGQVFSSMTASIGNLIIEKKNEYSLKIYNIMLLCNSWLYCFCAVSIFCLIEPFISIWIGKDYILPTFTLLIIVLNFYVQGLRKTDTTFKEAAGIFYADRHISIIEALLNIVFSLIFVKILGLAGVFVGTIISSLSLYFYSFPKYVYQKMFQKSFGSYLKTHLWNFLRALLVFSITILLNTLISTNSLILDLILKSLLCLVVPNVVYFILTFRSSEFQYLMQLLKCTKG